MKKYLFSLLAVMMVTIESVVLTSCNKDDEVNDSISIVGTWKYSWDGGFLLVNFDKDGMLESQEYDDGILEPKEGYFYTYNNNILIIFDVNEDAERGDILETAEVISLTKDKLVVKDWPDSGNCTFYKQ